MMGYAGNEGLGMMWKAVVVAYFKVQYYPSTCLEALKNAIRTRQNSR
jgi:hypothetical protein